MNAFQAAEKRCKQCLFSQMGIAFPAPIIDAKNAKIIEIDREIWAALARCSSACQRGEVSEQQAAGRCVSLFEGRHVLKSLEAYTGVRRGRQCRQEGGEGCPASLQGPMPPAS